MVPQTLLGMTFVKVTGKKKALWMVVVVVVEKGTRMETRREPRREPARERRRLVVVV